MNLEFRKIEHYKYADIKLQKLRAQFIDEKAFTDDYWIAKIFDFLFSFYEKYPQKGLNKKSEKEITRIIRDWLKNNEEFVSSSLVVESEAETEGTEQIGYNDLKFTRSFWKSKYFVIECKLLDESEILIKEYIYNSSKDDGGLYRFLINKYASNLDFGGMLGYVKKGNITSIIERIKRELSIFEHQSLIGIKFGNLIERQLLNERILGKEYTFQSKHTRFDIDTQKLISHIQIFHIFLDFFSTTQN